VTVRLLGLAASLREQSLNRRLLRVAVSLAEELGASVTEAEFREFEVPMYNQDLMDQGGLPPAAEAFRRRLEQVDGLLLASPEYNYSIPGTLKNLIDWVSRYRPIPFRGKSALLLSTSTGAVGGARGLWQLRIPLEGLGVFVFPSMFALPSGRQAFTEQGALVEPSQAERLRKMLAEYLEAAARLHARAGS
jgi:NAD(P)H-dependent FMN reductase